MEINCSVTDYESPLSHCTWIYVSRAFPRHPMVLFFIWDKMCICWKQCKNRNQEKMVCLLLTLFSRNLKEYFTWVFLVVVNKRNAIQIWVLQRFKSETRFWPFSSCSLVTAFSRKESQLTLARLTFRRCLPLCAPQHGVYWANWIPLCQG